MNPLKLMPALGLLLLCQRLSAQHMANLNSGDTTCIFGDKVNVRTQPEANAQVAFQLSAGEPVILLEELKAMYRVADVEMPWCQIRTFDGRKGYVWGGMLSLWGIKQDGAVCFAAGFAGEQPQCEVRAIRNGTIISKVSTTIPVGEGGVNGGKIIPGAKGLVGYRDLLVLNAGLEACGYLQMAWYILWNGQNLVSLPLCKSIFDGGNYYEESYLFPDDMANQQMNSDDPTRIYYQVSTGEEEEFSDESGWETSTSIKVHLLRWDGKKYVKPKEE